MDSRVNKRSHQACENCRRKKTRCPGERPKCSTCTRLQQVCHYSRHYGLFERSPGREREDRIQQLEDKMNLMLEGPITLDSYSDGLSSRDVTSVSTARPQSPTARGKAHDSANVQTVDTLPLAIPPKDIITEAIALYFQYCHKQPLWLFDADDFPVPENSPDEVVFGILSLALRYSHNHFLGASVDQLCRQYADAAHNLIMNRITRGAVRLSTLQSLCLIALAEYMANNTHLAWVHIGLVTSLAKCGEVDVELHEREITPALEARRKLFWSIHFLNQQYGPRSMQLNMLRDIHTPKYMAINTDSPREMGVKPPQIPQENDSSTKGGIWNYMVQLASLWNEVQQYVSHCASGDTTPPWAVESGYTIIGAHLMDIETRFPTTHRYDSMRFQEQSVEELHRDRGYWSPWLYLQFTYHAVHSVLNHPFLYSWRPQQSAQLAVPNTFWKTSSELALIHTTWTVRLIDMVTEKDYQLSDPFLGHTVAIAASIHIYYCRATDPAVRESAQRKVETCLNFLGDLATRWPRCRAIYRQVQALIQSAFSPSPGLDSQRPPRRTLSIDTELMWDILFHNPPKTSPASLGKGLFDMSFVKDPGERHSDKVTVETEIFHNSTRTVDTSDGGQALPPYSSTAACERTTFGDSGYDGWDRTDSVPVNSSSGQVSMSRQALAWSGSEYQGHSFMDIMDDPFYQFQDHENPYLGIWEIGNL
ncbi:hypothetical protein BDV59DRAFT_192981 [Aspergillus ambiguus]|uniref:uncharacterized protein n=1 Tax=Aspergillus ambiguus TaxID=176160 RepID=UPI003CCDBC2F